MVKNSPRRFDIYWVNLDPTIGTEVKKIRPSIIISPDELNEHLGNVIILPITSTIKKWPFRVAINHQGKKGEVMLEQIRSISKQRLYKQDGKVNSKTQIAIIERLQEMFS